MGGPHAQSAGRQSSILIAWTPIVAKLLLQSKRIPSFPVIGTPPDEQRMKRERTRPAEVVAALRMNSGDEPWSALQTQRKETLNVGCSCGRLAVPLANGAELRQPLGTTSRRLREHTVAAIPERKAAIHSLLESHRFAAPNQPIATGPNGAEVNSQGLHPLELPTPRHFQAQERSSTVRAFLLIGRRQRRHLKIRCKDQCRLPSLRGSDRPGKHPYRQRVSLPAMEHVDFTR